MHPLRVLQIEDDEDHALIIERELRRGGFDPRCTRVETAPDLRRVLAMQKFDLITSDYGLPRFDAPSALMVVREFPLDDVPFIIVSGTIPDTAVSQAMKNGASDFVSKSDLRRLVPAVQRELKEAQSRRARRVAETRFRTLARSLDGMVVTLNGDLVIEGVYGRAALLGNPMGEATLGASVSSLFTQDEGVEVERECRNVLADPATPAAPLQLVREAEEATFVEVTISPMIDESDELIGLLVAIRDVTQQRRLQAQAVTSDRMATIGTLAAGVAHEINNPLTALLSNIHLLGRDVERLASGDTLTPNILSSLAESVEDANDAAAMVLTIAGDLRTFSRESEERPKPVAVKAIVESALRMVRSRLEACATIVRDYGEAPPALAVESSLGQVFLNLLVNAAQAIPTGASRGTHEVRVRIRHEAESERVAISVTDTGQGMSEAVKQRLFSPFFTTKPSGVGTGLGLSICKRIVTSFGGEIVVESTLGVGSTFTVRLRAVSPRRDV